ncbi:carbohydrate ABC transporter permease [Shouchella clausii]|jgi:multiple sugar transport system permease protein|uniref:Sugar ABC transporter permease n=1 Tax=Shouchella clausii TaxID=79880 RepID=A0A268RYC4_SHOCL|nr:sugar ABC transporter permease [Shouchella clausii]PAD42027.1 sugar ABC transporter permease [Bacillus sp. 7520-S]SPT78425.1 binding-protein-dependent transporter inner membrane component [Niallia circulans]AST96154.1 sugar ABC transporter permease [Shouchella clausii]MBU8596045.1 sugar ABC transporter permease [Shouchella clausii]MCM3548542.1 sugar ABC transporter permease [Shouchella clausii]
MRIQTEELLASSKSARLRKKQKSSLEKNEHIAGWLFVAPMLIGVFMFVLLPIAATFVLSMTDWKFVQSMDQLKWVGFGNFTELMSDRVFLKSLLNNGIFLLTVPICMAISLLLAVVINKSVYMKGYFKVAFFMPYISSVVAIAVVWQVLFHPSAGPINQTLMALGIDNPPKWIADPNFSLISVMLIQIWISVGFNLIVYIAGLQAIPKQLYEAAEMDGANGWDKFRKITFPMVSPTSFFLLITGIIASFKVFDLIAVLTKGGPMHSSSVLVWHLYDTAFVNLDIGYSSAMAMVLFVIVFLITIIQWVGQKKWVNY